MNHCTQDGNDESSIDESNEIGVNSDDTADIKPNTIDHNEGTQAVDDDAIGNASGTTDHGDSSKNTMQVGASDDATINGANSSNSDNTVDVTKNGSNHDDQAGSTSSNANDNTNLLDEYSNDQDKINTESKLTSHVEVSCNYICIRYHS
jgi:hypothetical protein